MSNRGAPPGSGSSAAIVPGIQYLLRAHGHAVVVDGDTGRRPPPPSAPSRRRRAPVRRHRRAQTWPHLVIAVQQGRPETPCVPCSSSDCCARQGTTPLAVDGDFGPITKERVEFFQESWGLSQDGVAGRETWSFFSTFVPGQRPWPLVKQGDAGDELARARRAASAARPRRDDRRGRRLRPAERRGGARLPADPARVQSAPPSASSTGRA